LGFLRFGKPDIQHTVFKVGFHFVTLDFRGQPDGTLKRAVVAFAGVIVFLFFLGFLFLLAADGQDVSGYIKIDVFTVKNRRREARRTNPFSSIIERISL